MLYKGPIPVGAVGFPLVAYLLLWRRWRLPLQMALPIGLPLFLALWLPWVIYICVHLGADALFRWRAEFVDRASGELPNVAGHAANPLLYLGYYIPVIAAFALPWTLSLPPSWLLPWRLRRSHATDADPNASGAGDRAPLDAAGQGAVHVDATSQRDAARFLLVWGVSVWLFFTLSVGKENRYILPALPPLCALVGVYFSDLFRTGRPRRETLVRLTCRAALVAIVAGVIGGGFGLREWAKRNAPDAFPDLLGGYAPVAVVMAIGFAAAAVLYERRLEDRSFAAICLTMATAWCLTWRGLMPILAAQRPAIELAAVLNQPDVRDLDTYYLGVQDARVIYYSGRPIPRVVSSIDMFRFTDGRRDPPHEMRKIGETTVQKLRDTSRPVLFVAGVPEFNRLTRGLEQAGQLDGLPIHEWHRTAGPKDKHRLILFGNVPPARIADFRFPIAD